MAKQTIGFKFNKQEVEIVVEKGFTKVGEEWLQKSVKDTVTKIDTTTGKQLESRQWCDGEITWVEDVTYDSENREVFRNKKFTNGGVVTTATSYDIDGRKVMCSVIGCEDNMVVASHATVWEYGEDGSITTRHMNKDGQTFEKVNSEGIMVEMLWNNAYPNMRLHFVADKNTMTMNHVQGKLRSMETGKTVGEATADTDGGITTFNATICGSLHKMTRIDAIGVILDHWIDDIHIQEAIPSEDVENYYTIITYDSEGNAKEVVEEYDLSGRLIGKIEGNEATTYAYTTEEVYV